ncbi:MAG: DUF58 domain-containing protein [Anaerolineae bacterium]|nr:DUF58 domain-containing protein [Anaerolineae bacterium]
MPNLLPFLIVLFIVAAVLRIDFFFTLLYFLFAVYLLSRLWTQALAKQLRFSRKFVDRAFIGDEVPVDIHIANRGWLVAPWVDVRDSLPAALASPPFYREVFGLGPRQERVMRYWLTCRQRGYYQVGPLRLETGDLLGIQQSISVNPLDDAATTGYMIVYPRVVPLAALGLPTHSPLAVLRARSPLFEDPHRVMGVRDYHKGDSPRRIHWTATAGAGRLLVKQYEPAIARDTLIFLDMNQERYPDKDRYVAPEMAIVTAASLANHITVREGLPVGLATQAWDPLIERRVRLVLAPRTERVHLMSVLEILARIDIAYGEEDFPDLLRRESKTLPWGTTLVVVTPAVDVPLMAALLSLARSGFALAVILVQRALPAPALKAELAQLGITLHHVWREEQLGSLA